MKPGFALLAAALLLAGGAAIYYVSLRPAAPGPAVVPKPAPTPSKGRDLPTRPFLARLVKGTPKPGLPDGAPQKAPDLALDEGMLPWEREVSHVLSDPTTNGTKAQQLMALLPNLPEEALGPVTAQALEWLQDSDYATSVLPLILNVQTHGAVTSELYRDLAERPPGLALPTLLTIARTAEHPYAATARDNLELLVGQNLGDDWPAWEAAIKQRLTGQE